MNTPPDDRMALAKAYQRATRGVTVAIGMVVPGLIGHLIDRQLGTRALLTIIGFGVGMTYGIWQLGRMSRPRARDNGPSGRDDDESNGTGNSAYDNSK